MKRLFKQILFFSFFISLITQHEVLNSMGKDSILKAFEVFSEEERINAENSLIIQQLDDEIDDLMGELMEEKDPSVRNKIDARLKELDFQKKQIRQVREKKLMDMLTHEEQKAVIEYVKKRNDFFKRKEAAKVAGGIPFYELDQTAYLPYSQPRDRSDVCLFFVESFLEKEIPIGLWYIHRNELLGCAKCDGLGNASSPSEPVVASASCRIVPRNFVEDVNLLPFRLNAARCNSLTSTDMSASMCNRSVRSKLSLSEHVDESPLKGTYVLNQQCTMMQALLNQRQTRKYFKLKQSKVAKLVHKNESVATTKKSLKSLLSFKKQDLSVKNPTLKYFLDLKNRVNVARSVNDLKQCVAELEVLVKSKNWEAIEFLGLLYSEGKEVEGKIEFENSERAIELLELCAKENPNAIKLESLFVLGKLLLDKNDLEHGRHFIELSLSRHCKVKRDDFVVVAEMYLKSDQLDQAIDWLKKIGNDEIIMWYKGYAALRKNDIPQAVCFLEQAFPLRLDCDQIPKDYLILFDFVRQALLAQIDNPDILALLARIELTVGLDDAKFNRSVLIEKLLNISDKEKTFSVNFVTAYLYAYGIEVQASSKMFLNSLKKIYSLVAGNELIGSVGGMKKLIELLNKYNDFCPLLRKFIDHLRENFIIACLMNGTSESLSDDLDSCIFSIFICNVLSDFFATRHKSDSDSYNAALFFMISEWSLIEFGKKYPEISIKNQTGLSVIVDRILNLSSKENKIYEKAKLSFYAYLRLLANIKEDRAKLEGYINDFIASISNLKIKENEDSEDFVIAAACGVCGSFFVRKNEIAKAKRSFELGFKFCKKASVCGIQRAYLMIDYPENEKEVVSGKDILVKIFSENSSFIDVACKLGECFDPRLKCGVSKKCFVPKFKNAKDAFFYYEQVANLGGSIAAARWIGLFMKNFEAENAAKALKYLEIAGTRITESDRAWILKTINCECKSVLTGADQSLEDKFIDAFSYKDTDPIASLKKLVVFFEKDFYEISKITDNSIDRWFQLLAYFVSYVHIEDQKILGLIKLFITRIDKLILLPQFLNHIEEIECDLRRKKFLITQIILACKNQSNFAYMGDLLIYYLDKFVSTKNDYKSDSSLKGYLIFFREHVGADEKLNLILEKISRMTQRFEK